MTIAVTGATGHLGRLVVDALLETQDPDSIVAVVRDEAKAAPLAEKGVQLRVANYDDPAALEAALAGVAKVLLISSSEIGKRFEQHRNVIDAAKTVGVPYVAYTSAPGATSSALILAPEHKATEEYLAASGLAFTVLRNGWYTENYVQQLETAKQTGTVVAAVGDGRVASASRADFAAGAAAVLLSDGHEGSVYELSGDVAWHYDELAQAISEITGSPVTYRPVDPAEYIGILTGAGLDEATAGFVVALDQNTADGLLAGVTGELSALIGRPTTPLLEGLGAAVA